MWRTECVLLKKKRLYREIFICTGDLKWQTYANIIYKIMSNPKSKVNTSKLERELPPGKPSRVFQLNKRWLAVEFDFSFIRGTFNNLKNHCIFCFDFMQYTEAITYLLSLYIFLTNVCLVCSFSDEKSYNWCIYF